MDVMIFRTNWIHFGIRTVKPFCVMYNYSLNFKPLYLDNCVWEQTTIMITSYYARPKLMSLSIVKFRQKLANQFLWNHKKYHILSKTSMLLI